MCVGMCCKEICIAEIKNFINYSKMGKGAFIAPFSYFIIFPYSFIVLLIYHLEKLPTFARLYGALPSTACQSSLKSCTSSCGSSASDAVCLWCQTAKNDCHGKMIAAFPHFPLLKMLPCHQTYTALL